MQAKEHFYCRLLKAVRIGLWLAAALAATVASTQACAAENRFQELVNQVPWSANAVAILNMEKAKNSPMGQRENWKGQLEKAFEDGVARVPPHATRFILASQIDLESFEPVWEAAVMDFDQAMPLDEIAKVRGGDLEMIEGVRAIVRPGGTFILQGDPKMASAIGPVDRQAVVRWLRQSHGQSPAVLSPYLQQAATYSDQAGSEIIMVIDLDGALSSERVAKYLEGKKELLNQWKADYRELARMLSAVTGVRIGVKLGTTASAKVVVDLRVDASAISAFAKPLLLEVLADRGLWIEDLNSWKAEVKGREVSLAGSLSKDGLRRLLTLLQPPAQADSATDSPQPTSPGELSTLQLKASQAHFKAVTAMFNDLKQDTRSSKSISQTQLWFDKYAKRIERLPILNVDKELVDYSGWVAQELRSIRRSPLHGHPDATGGQPDDLRRRRGLCGRLGRCQCLWCCRWYDLQPLRGLQGVAVATQRPEGARVGHDRHERPPDSRPNHQGHGGHAAQNDVEVPGRVLEHRGIWSEMSSAISTIWCVARLEERRPERGTTLREREL